MKKKLFSILSLCCVTVSFMLAAGCSNNEATAKVTLGEYKGIEVEVTETVVDDAAIDAYVDKQLANVLEYTEVDRAIKIGDKVNFDYIGTVDGVAFDRGSQEGAELVIGSGSFIPGFEDQMIGLMPGESKDLEVTFPDPYTGNADLSGAEAVFAVKINKVSEKSEITDEMVQTVSQEYTTVKAFRDYCEEQLEAQAVESDSDAKFNAIWEKVMENTTVEDLPETRIQERIALLNQQYEEYAAYYNMSFEDYLTANSMTQEKFDEELRAASETYVKNQSVIEAIAKAEGLAVDDEGYKTYISQQAATQSMTEEEFETAYGTNIKENLLYEMVRDFLIENAKITVTV